jgi:hypothetical protein
MEEDKIIRNLSVYNQHIDIIEAMQCVSKAKLKKGSERCVLLEKAKNKLFPFSGDQIILQSIVDIDRIRLY